MILDHPAHINRTNESVLSPGANSVAPHVQQVRHLLSHVPTIFTGLRLHGAHHSHVLWAHTREFFSGKLNSISPQYTYILLFGRVLSGPGASVLVVMLVCGGTWVARNATSGSQYSFSVIGTRKHQHVFQFMFSVPSRPLACGEKCWKITLCRHQVLPHEPVR